MATREPDLLDQTLRERVEALHDAVRDNRMAINALTAEFGHWRKEPRLRTLIDQLHSELEQHRVAIERLTNDCREQRDALRRLTDPDSSAS